MFRHADVVCLCPSCDSTQCAFCMPCSLLMLVGDARGDHMLLYSAGSGVNRVQAVLSGFCVLFCPGKNCMYSYGCMYISWLHSCLCV